MTVGPGAYRKYSSALTILAARFDRFASVGRALVSCASRSWRMNEEAAFSDTFWFFSFFKASLDFLIENKST